MSVIFKKHNLCVSKNGKIKKYPFAVYNITLPEDFIKLTYLESDKSQYIDTRWIPGEDYEIDIKYSVTNKFQPNGFGWILGATNSLRIETEWNNYMFYQSGDSRVDLEKPIENNIYNVKLTKYLLECNGSEYHVQNPDYHKGSTPLALFTINSGNSFYESRGVRIYNVKCYDGDELVRDFIPCLDEYKKPCMYDDVNKETYYNLGNGEFSYHY